MKILKEKLAVIVVGLFIIVSMSGLFIFQPQFFKHLHFSLYDSLVAKIEQTPPTGLVSIIDIDEKSLQEFGQWPWPRYRVAELLSKLEELQVLAVGIDFVFAEPDRTSLNHILNNIEKQNKPSALDVPFPSFTNKLPTKLLDNDSQMATVLKQGPFVLGYSFLFPSKTAEEKNTSSLQENQEQNLNNLNILFLYQEETSKELSWYQPNQVLNNLTLFTDATSSSGFFNVSPDNDGVIRKVPLVMNYNNKTYPNLSLATLIKAFNAEQIIFKQGQNILDTLVVDEQEVPLDKNGNFWVHFRDSHQSAFETISAADILNNKITKEQLGNHIVLLGTSATGLFDLRSTPYNPVFTGVEVHATVIDNILRGDFINQAPWSWSAELALIILAGILSLSIVLWSRAIVNLTLNTSLILLLIFCAWWWLDHDRIYISVLYPIFTILLNFSILSLLQYRVKEKKLVIQTLKHNAIQKEALIQLQQAKDELQEFSDSLEEQVKQRTQELAKINQHTRESIEYASLIQSSLIPNPDILNQFFSDSFAIWSPKDIVGGDIYLVEQLNENELLIMVIDCTGHGVPGAFVTMLVKAIEQQIIAKQTDDETPSPAKMLSFFNRQIKSLLNQNDQESISNAGFDGAILYINKQEKICRYAGASTPLFIIKNNELTMIKGDRYSIGYNSSDINKEFTDHEVSLSKPTTLYVSTDGYLDQPGGAHNIPFGKKRFKQLLNDITEKTMSEQKDILLKQLMDYLSDERVDDVTLLGIRTL